MIRPQDAPPSLSGERRIRSSEPVRSVISSLRPEAFTIAKLTSCRGKETVIECLDVPRCLVETELLSAAPCGFGHALPQRVLAQEPAYAVGHCGRLCRRHDV